MTAECTEYAWFDKLGCAQLYIQYLHAVLMTKFMSHIKLKNTLGFIVAVSSKVFISNCMNDSLQTVAS